LVFYAGGGFIATAIIAETGTITAAIEMTDAIMTTSWAGSDPPISKRTR
jgi:hypothetical protein